jgi:hypothetical protein
MSHSAVGYYDIVAQCIQSLKNFEVLTRLKSVRPLKSSMSGS